MRLLVSQNKWFFVPYCLILGVVGYFLITCSKSGIHLFINGFNTEGFDVFFKYLTILGDGICLPFFLLYMLTFRKFRDGLYLVVVFLISGFVVQFLKRIVFHDIARPIKYFGESVHLHLVNGVDQLCCNSFPSGHSATAFGFYLCFAIVSKNQAVKFAMLLLACCVAFSRVYLSQHFLIDIFAGSLIGVITATACYPWIYTLKGNWLDRNLKTINTRRPV